MEKVLEEASTVATSVLASIPQRLARVNALLASEFPVNTPSQLAVAFTPLVSANATSNPQLGRLVTLVLDEIHVAIHELQRLERWIQLLTPRVADGNNFGVEVQKSVQLQISASRTALQKSWDAMTDYYWQRATAYEKFAAKVSKDKKKSVSTTKEEGGKDGAVNKTSQVESTDESSSESSVIPDLLVYVVAVDVKWYFNLQRTLESVADHYAFTLDAVEKNSSKIKLPRVRFHTRAAAAMSGGGGNPVSMQWKYPPELLFNDESLLDIILGLRTKIELLEKNEMGTGEIPQWLVDAMQNIANNSEAMVECQSLKDQLKYMKQNIDALQKDIVILRRDVVAAKTLSKRRGGVSRGGDDEPDRSEQSSRRGSVLSAEIRRGITVAGINSTNDTINNGNAMPTIVAGGDASQPNTSRQPSSVAEEAMKLTVALQGPSDGGQAISSAAMEQLLEPVVHSIERQKEEFAVMRENSQAAKDSVMRLQAEMKRRDALIQARNSKHEAGVKILMDKLNHDLRACVTHNEMIGFEQKIIVLQKQEVSRLTDEFSALFGRVQEDLICDTDQNHVAVQALAEKQAKTEVFCSDMSQALENVNMSKVKSDENLKLVIHQRAESLYNEIKRIDDVLESCSLATMADDMKFCTEKLGVVGTLADDNKKRISTVEVKMADNETIYNTNFSNIYEGMEKARKESVEALRRETTRIGVKLVEHGDVQAQLGKFITDVKTEAERNFAAMRTKHENHELETDAMRANTESALQNLKEKIFFCEEANLALRAASDTMQLETKRLKES
ncbi:hypothetical protein DYB37_000393 [Aphanomyces astaci]|uniref:Proteasome activator PA28 C-terminal domain-containing protein n=1 Tax=Aphanomyces astaci TaxID=112090 RepID=A0A418D016_APHAT|nr:hypothetical protein DYB35_001595 [Aphanomyces astaci]RHZ28748.1 hypothetical protein DYB37_000393 [Aphanomyces astaci]